MTVRKIKPSCKATKYRKGLQALRRVDLEAYRVMGRAFAYARAALCTRWDKRYISNIGSPPYSALDGQTIAQRAYVAGYNAALEERL